jgi:hypothetical protein
MEQTRILKPILGFLTRFTLVHFVTYWIFGLLFFTLLGYSALYARPEIAVFMRPTTSIWVYAGPLFQLIRGPIMALAIFPFRKVFLHKERGWMLLWGLFIALAILSPAGPTPGSIEGIVYTVLPLQFHLIGLPEALLQTLALSFLFCFWERRPEEKKIWIPLLAIFIAILALSILGVLFGGTAA